MIAVITADLVGSSLYSTSLMNRVINALKEEFLEIEEHYSPEKQSFQIYRGDSFQGIISSAPESLRVALQLKSAVNRVNGGKSASRGSSKVCDLRLAIGIGEAGYEGDNISESNGQAFQFSGLTLDEMKNDIRKTRLKTPNEELNAEFEASLFLLDALMEKWSTASAEVIYYLLKGMKETEIAGELKISQSAVNQRKKAAGWDAVSALLKRFHEAVSKKNSDE